YFFFFFFNDTATTEIYTLSLHDALPISFLNQPGQLFSFNNNFSAVMLVVSDRKSTRLNSSHLGISYAVFCLKKNTRRRTGRVRGRDCGGAGVVIYVRWKR